MTAKAEEIVTFDKDDFKRFASEISLCTPEE
jgi:hypothetical protein